MSQGVLTPPGPTLDTCMAAVQVEAAPRSLVNSISRVVGVAPGTVAQLLDRQRPVVRELSSYKRDEFLAGWQWFYLQSLAQLQDDWTGMKWSERRDAAVIMGIATERGALVAGQPTSIVAGVHEHRHELPQLAETLALVARRLGASAPRPPAPIINVIESEHQGIPSRGPAIETALDVGTTTLAPAHTTPPVTANGLDKGIPRAKTLKRAIASKPRAKAGA